MKLYLCMFAVIAAFITAMLKERKYYMRLQSNRRLCELSDIIRDNFNGRLLPITYLISEFLSEDNELVCGYTDLSDCMEKLRSFTGNALDSDRIFECISVFSSVNMADFEEKSQKLREMTDLSLEKAEQEYKKCKNTVFYVYPGIATIVSMIFI